MKVPSASVEQYRAQSADERDENYVAHVSATAILIDHYRRLSREVLHLRVAVVVLTGIVCAIGGVVVNLLSR